MLVKFKVKNFLSFKNEAVFSMEATSDKELLENTFLVNKKRYLKEAVIFGANEFGKTNLLKALIFLRRFALESYEISLKSDVINIKPFRFSVTNLTKPSFLEVTFIYKKVTYRLGIELTSKEIINEYLYVTEPSEKPKEKLFYKRDKKSIEFGSSYSKYKKVTPIKKNVLLLTKLGLDFDEIDNGIFSWIKNDLNVIYGYDKSYGKYTRSKIESDPIFKSKVVNYLRAMGSSIEDLKVRKTKISDARTIINEVPPELRNMILNNNVSEIEKKELIAIHKKYDDKNKEVGTEEIHFDEESFGTNQMFNLLGPIIDTLQNGKTLVVDELENSIHPNVLKFIASLFNSKINRNKAQLIFTTHSVPLLDKNDLGDNIFRRDQILFVDKNDLGESSVFSLSDFKIDNKKIRKDESYLKNYLLGKYEAVPFIDDFLID